MIPQAAREGYERGSRFFLTLPPSAGLLALFALAFVLPGLFMHDPWKSFDAIGIEIIHTMHVSGDWLVPRVAGDPWLEDPPLFHWTALLLAKVAAFALPFHDAARAASGLAVLAACAFLYLGARLPRQEGDSRTEAAAAVLLLIGTIGLMVHAHEAIADLTTLAACSAALAALIRCAERPVAMGLGFGAALGIAFLSTGFVTPVALLGAAVLSIAACPELRSRRSAVFLAVALPVAVILASSWPLMLLARSPDLFSIWWIQATRQQGAFGANLGYFLEISAWFLWPLWPLALWTLYARRAFLLSREIFVPLAAFVLLFAGVAFMGPRQDINLLGAVPPLVLFCSHGLPALRRGAAAALDWFGVMTFGFFAFLIWGGYIAMMTGWPPKVANNFAKLAPGFVPQFAGLPFVTALVLTVLWLVLILRLPPAPSRSATRWAAGIIVFWGTFATLWMPWADHIKSYRSVAEHLKAKLPPGDHCIAGRNMGTPQRAALSYHSGVRVLSPAWESRCSFLVVQGSPRHERDAPGAGWRKITETGRPGDKGERFRLYRKER
jgi:4-amino-4-deoxy-L-arabinose transferase-like glycosyltransferase